MTLVLKLALSLHVILGVVGVIGSYAAWMNLAGRHVNPTWIQRMSLTAFASYLVSWIIGGYYYVVHYGGSVKPGIKAGDYPWAHSLFTEGKEHVFLFLTFLALVLVVAAYKKDLNLKKNPKAQKALVWLAGSTTVIGVLVTVSGFIISGSVR